MKEKQDFESKISQKESTETSFTTTTDDEGLEENKIQKTNFELILENNEKWAKECIKKEPEYFTKLLHIQKPKFLWIGCADSRVPANEIMGLKPGEVFVHRNVANIIHPSDINALSVIQYAVEHLGVEDIIVAGHYGCGGIKAAFQQNDFGPLESWLSHTRDLRSKFKESLIGSQTQKEDTLVELNVRHQVINVSRIPVVQRSWQKGKKLIIHGVVYNLHEGILKDLGLTTWQLEHVPEEYRLIKRQKSKERL